LNETVNGKRLETITSLIAPKFAFSVALCKPQSLLASRFVLRRRICSRAERRSYCSLWLGKAKAIELTDRPIPPTNGYASELTGIWPDDRKPAKGAKHAEVVA